MCNLNIEYKNLYMYNCVYVNLIINKVTISHNLIYSYNFCAHITINKDIFHTEWHS